MFPHKSGHFEKFIKEENETEQQKAVKRTFRDFLPSRTLHHKRKVSALPPPRLLTLDGKPFQALSYTTSDLNEDIRRRLTTGPKNKSILRQSERRFTEFGTIAEEAEFFSEGKTTFLEQLAALSFLPIPLGEKREQRKSIVCDLAMQKPSYWHMFTSKVRDFRDKMYYGLRVWSDSLRLIEGLYGTSIASFFFFLRWILYLNLIMSAAFLLLVVIPQIFHSGLSRKNSTYLWEADESDTNVSRLGYFVGDYTPPILEINVDDAASVSNWSSHLRLRNVSDFCARKYHQFLRNITSWDAVPVLQNLIQGMGWMADTLMFIGFYSPVARNENISTVFNLGVAYLDVLIVLYIICIYMMINYVAEGLVEKITLGGDSQTTYSSILYSSWDFCITSPDAATLTSCGLYYELKEVLAEIIRQKKVAKWSFKTKARMFCIRSSINGFVILSLVVTYYVLYTVVDFQIKEMRKRAAAGFVMLLIQFLPAGVFTCFNLMLPALFNILVRFEDYGSEQSLDITLMRIVVLRLASIVILIASFYVQITCKPKDICGFGLEKCLSPLCWETYIGQQMYKLVMMDLFVILGITFFWEVPRRYAVTHFRNPFIQKLGLQTFDIPTQVLAIVYSQTLCWIGAFFAPLLPVVCVFKTIIVFYTKKYTLLHNCIPPKIPYRASRSNVVFIAVLLLSFFTTIAVLGYSITGMETSPGCSPFRYYYHMTDCVEDFVRQWDPELASIMDFIFSAGFAVPAILVLCVMIYYYLTTTNGHKHKIERSKEQLVMEGQDRQFLLTQLSGFAHVEEQNLKNDQGCVQL